MNDFPYEVRCIDDLAQLNIAEQGAEFHAADVIFSTHGSQMSNVLFSRPGTYIFELLCSKNGYYLPFGPFKMKMGFKYSWLDHAGAGVNGAYDPHPMPDDGRALICNAASPDSDFRYPLKRLLGELKLNGLL